MNKTDRSKPIRNVDLNQAPSKAPDTMTSDEHYYKSFFESINEKLSVMDDEVEEILGFKVQDNTESLNRLYKLINDIIKSTPVIKTDYIGKLVKKFMNEVAHTHQGMMIEAKKDGTEKGYNELQDKYRQEMNSMEDDIKDLERDKQDLEDKVNRLEDKYMVIKDQYQNETSKQKIEIKRLTDLVDGVQTPKSKDVKWSI
jgi:predicted RNase H-like nuclease (RuvC/YqgF family)